MTMLDLQKYEVVGTSGFFFKYKDDVSVSSFGSSVTFKPIFDLSRISWAHDSDCRNLFYRITHLPSHFRDDSPTPSTVA